MMATGGEHGCDPVPEGSGEAREGGRGDNGGVSEALHRVWYTLRNAEIKCMYHVTISVGTEWRGVCVYVDTRNETRLCSEGMRPGSAARE